MTENIFLYIIPILPPQENLEVYPEEKGWKIAENKGPNPYVDYINYYKKINFNGKKWDISCRKYQKLNSAIFIFKCLEEDIAKDFIDSNEIYFKYKNECGIFGSLYIQQCLLRIFENNKIMNEFNYLCSEINEKNEFYIITESCFNLIISNDGELNKTIKDNIITLLSLSSIALSMQHEFFRNGIKQIKQQDVIKFFWGHKSHIIDCPASKVFPMSFDKKMISINNLLDYRHMDLIEFQNKLSSAQTQAVESQNDILNEIHKVETGILYLTLFVIFDVTFTVLSEFVEPVEKIINREFGTLWGLLIPFIIALIFSFTVYKKISPPNKKTQNEHAL